MTRLYSNSLPMVFALALMAGHVVGGQAPDAKPSAPASPTPPASAPASPPSKPVLDRAALEKQFAESLDGAVLQGVWQMTTEGGLKGTGKLSEPREESYHIATATKLNEEHWVIQARIQFADKDVNIPVPVRVVWAEDTAIITLSDLSMPLLGTYSARVMVHNGFYSGVWYSNPQNYGGVMSGRILKAASTEKSEPQSKLRTEK